VLFRSLLLLWLAAFLTAFLDAGPATALLLPIAAGLPSPPEHVLLWALALGVLAGSSATLTGATAGPVATTLIEDLCIRQQITLAGGNTLTPAHFSRLGGGSLLIFLTVSSCYILLLSGIT